MNDSPDALAAFDDNPAAMTVANDPAPPEAGMVTTDSFDGHSIERRAETATTAAAEQARALVEARYVMALKRPRNIDNVRVRLLQDCRRPGFAEVALYSKPAGNKKIEGPSIRMAEAALRHMGNVDQDTQTIYDDAKKRIVRVSVTDLETNATYSTDITIEKTVERKSSKGREVLTKRKNIYNDDVYIVVATEDEMLQKVNSLVSKALRTNGLRLVPGDILDEAMRMVRHTLDAETRKDPDANRKRMIDRFADRGIMPDQLSAFLGHPIEQITAGEAKELLGVINAITDGETIWAAVMELRRVETGAAGDGKKTAAGGMRERAKAKAAAARSSADDPPPREPGQEG